MEGNAKIIKLIARDEALHLTTTQHIINTLASGAEGEVLLKRLKKNVLTSLEKQHSKKKTGPNTSLKMAV